MNEQETRESWKKEADELDKFNDQYNEWLDTGNYGLGFYNEKVVKYLHEIFAELTTRPDFKYQQIKLKFGRARFYANGITREENNEIENKINELVNNNETTS